MSRMIARGLSCRAFCSPSRAVRGADHLIAGLGEILLQQVKDVRIVIDRQHHRSMLRRDRGFDTRGTAGQAFQLARPTCSAAAGSR